MAPLEAVWLGTVGYTEAWDEQRRRAEARRAGTAPDTLLLLEHPPVFTMGRNGEPAHVPGGAAGLVQAGAEYHEVDRGGSVTFHGPGQLVAYPIVGLADSFPLAAHPGHGDVVEYLRALEQALIATVGEWGISAVQRPPYTGIWIEPDAVGGWRKLAAIGVKLARGVTTHGVALNVTTDLAWFDHIVPCGISDAGVCSIASLAGATPTVEEVAAVLATHAATALGRRLTVPA